MSDLSLRRAYTRSTPNTSHGATPIGKQRVRIQVAGGRGRARSDGDSTGVLRAVAGPVRFAPSVDGRSFDSLVFRGLLCSAPRIADVASRTHCAALCAWSYALVKQLPGVACDRNN